MADPSRRTKLGLFVLGFLAAAGVEAVRADEAYLCEGGRVVEVPFGRLEELKRTDPCIAAYYGVTRAPSKNLETGALKVEELPPAAGIAFGLSTPAEPAARPAVAATPKPATGSDRLKRRIAKATVPPPRPAPGTDYRNVVLLNAAPGEPALFRHER